jgi:hypothetical protein
LSRDVGDILGRLESSFDFEAGDAGSYEVGYEGVRGQVLRAQQIFYVAEIDVFAVADQVIWQAAGLGALAAVRAAATERFAREALAGIGYAQRAVDKRFEFDCGLTADRLDFGDREFAGEDHALDAEFRCGTDAFAASECHLRRGVYG